MMAVKIAQWGCGGFFLLALLTGVWKYAHIRASEDATAPVYVDISHRAAFMYAFSCLLLAYFANLSQWPAWWNTVGVGVSVAFFATAQSTYVLHGFLRDTDNQLQRPHKLGDNHVSSALVHAYMVALAMGEIGGFLIIFSGAMIA